MYGLMQDWPLLIPRILDHAAKWHGDREIVSHRIEGDTHRYGYRDLHSRTRRLAKVLLRLGLKQGDRIGTFAWNTHRHLEVYYATAGTGVICHTVNPRLFPQQIAYIVNHAEDRVIFSDLNVLPILEGLADQLPGLEAVVVMTDRERMPATTKLRRLLCYEDLMAEADDDFRWADIDERSALTLCYTSGTTGNPKGVLYSHRAIFLHALMISGGDCLGFDSADNVLPIVPMFHANAWCLPYTAPLAGAKLVLPGIRLDGASVYETLEAEKITYTSAVPTVWLMLLQHLEKTGGKLSTLKKVTIGGSAVPRSMIETFQDRYGVTVYQGWGMTEMSPVGTITKPSGSQTGLTHDQLLDLKCKAGRPIFSVDMKIVDGAGREQPHDGKAFGNILVRGPGIVSGYFKGEGGTVVDDESWFDTGDVGTLDEHGFLTITDRSKDVIKSGGEWISSIDLENVAVGHPDVAEAAVIGVAHPKWDERPLLVIVRKEGRTIDEAAILAFMQDKVARWWLPDEVVFVDEIPHTATGKIQKTALRERFRDYRLATATAAE